MAEKVTVMVLKVDLQCPCCYKKVKKILCKFPQIRDQVYDEKANTVTITVVCCSPEKIRDKLCRKGSKVIKSIEIKDPPKPKQPEKPKEPEKPKIVVIEKPKEPEKANVVVVEKPKEPEKPKEAPKPDPPKNRAPGPASNPLPLEMVQPYPVRTCCGQCYEGYGGGPCYHGYGVPPPPPPCYSSFGQNKSCHVIRSCDYYFSEENPQSCTIM